MKPIRRSNDLALLRFLLAVAVHLGGCYLATEFAPLEPAQSESDPPIETGAQVNIPSLEPIATQGKSAPQIRELANQSISDWELFPPLHLNSYLYDPDTPAEQITWRVTGNVELLVQLHDDKLMVMLPYRSWVGTESLSLQACDPDDQCANAEMAFSVRDENDPPQISAREQIFWHGENTLTLPLANLAYDEESPEEELTWSYSGGGDLVIELLDEVLSVSLPDENWRGAEPLRLEICDPQGLCSTENVVFRTLAKDDVVITLVGNAGFLLTAGSKQVLVDSLFGGGRSSGQNPGTIEQLKNAQPPFDEVDLLLATHSHADHFDAGMVANYLRTHIQTAFAAPEDAVKQVQAACQDCTNLGDRLQFIQLSDGESAQFSLNGITLEAMFLSHGVDAPPNLGYLIEMGNTRFFHSGDFDVRVVTLPYIQEYELPGKGIDIALIPWFILPDEKYHHIVRDGIQARWLIPMHFGRRDMEQVYLIQHYFPESIIYTRTLDSWVMPANE